MAEPFSYLLIKVLLLAVNYRCADLGALQLYLDGRQGKFAGNQKYITLAIDVPRNSEQTIKAVENIFAIVKGTKSIITFKEKWVYGKYLLSTSFEIVSINGYIQFYLRCSSSFQRSL